MYLFVDFAFFVPFHSTRNNGGNIVRNIEGNIEGNILNKTFNKTIIRL